MRIFLCRHGKTTGDIEDRFGGDYDDPLTTKGKAQASELADKLDGFGIELIYHSPRIRAVETAKVVSEKLKINSKVAFDLRERNAYGVLTGLTKSEAKEKFPTEVEKLSKSKLHHNVTGSEDYFSFKSRVLSEFQKIVSSSEKIICIVSHSGPISCIIRELCKIEIKKISDCGILETEYDDKSKKLDICAIDGVEFEK